MKKKFQYDKYINLRDSYNHKVSRLSNIRFLLFLVMIISFILKYYYYPKLFQVIFVLSLVLFIIMVIVHDKYFKIYYYYDKYVEVMDTYVKRKNGEWKNFSDTGSDFLCDEMMFFYDFDIFGNDSLFQYLSVCKTLGGRENLRDKLSNLEIDLDELKRNQEAVLELSKRYDFDIQFQVAMQYYDQKKIHFRNGFSYFEQIGKKGIIDLVVAMIAGGLCLVFFVLGCLGMISFHYFYGMFLFNLVISNFYVFIFKEEFANLDKIVSIYGKLGDVFQVILKEKFQSSKMKDIQKRMKKAREELSNLNRFDTLNSLRNNLVANLFFSGFFCFNLLVMCAFSRFLERNFKEFHESICDLEELEALVSLAGIGIVRENCCVPEYCDQVRIRFCELQHPLIDENICVGNDFSTGNGVNIITGSNMGGKSTFIRTIGINLILMQAGGLVCAREMEASYFKIFSSMRVTDNVDKGISTFYGELLRIQEMIQYVDRGNMLVLIDEIFKGTNYQDRMYGAKKVIEKLKNKKIIALVTTHDFELCDEKGICNYHVKEDYEGDNIVFDYKIRKGKCSSTNAKYLMKKLGIID